MMRSTCLHFIHPVSVGQIEGTKNGKNITMKISPHLTRNPFDFACIHLRTVKLIREDKTVEAYDILELQCELVAERMRFVDSQKEVPPDMDQAIRTLIWAADRSEVRKSGPISDAPALYLSG